MLRWMNALGLGLMSDHLAVWTPCRLILIGVWIPVITSHNCGRRHYAMMVHHGCCWCQRQRDVQVSCGRHRSCWMLLLWDGVMMNNWYRGQCLSRVNNRRCWSWCWLHNMMDLLMQNISWGLLWSRCMMNYSRCCCGGFLLMRLGCCWLHMTNYLGDMSLSHYLALDRSGGAQKS